MRKAKRATWQGIGIVRDPTGKPKFDDINAIPDEYKAVYRQLLTADDVAKLTPTERKALGYGNHP